MEVIYLDGLHSLLDLSIVGNPPEGVSGIKLKSVANALVSVEDQFILKFVDEETFLANESQKAREELARMSSLSNENETLPIEQVAETTIETTEVDEGMEVEETPPEPIEAEYEFSNVSTDDLNNSWILLINCLTVLLTNQLKNRVH